MTPVQTQTQTQSRDPDRTREGRVGLVRAGRGIGDTHEMGVLCGR
jgi:hypothetical protein